MSETRVGHTKADPTDTYIGRGPDGRHLHTTEEIGDRGWLGNPYPVGEEYTRAESIAAFRADFEERIENDAAFREAVAALEGDRLGCWCQRLDEDEPACHGEVIAEWVDRLTPSREARRVCAACGEPTDYVVDHDGTPGGTAVSECCRAGLRVEIVEVAADE